MTPSGHVRARRSRSCSGWPSRTTRSGTSGSGPPCSRRARRRPQPGRDDKVVAAWNGLAVAALAEGGALLDRPDWVAAAERCADLLRDLHLVDGRLRRTSRDGVVGRHGGRAGGLRRRRRGAARAAPGDGRPGSAGRRPAGCWTWCSTRFGDGRGGFYDTADDAEQLVRRPQDPTDGATPAALPRRPGALLTYAALTGSARHREAAEAALAGRRRWSGERRGSPAGRPRSPRRCSPGPPRSSSLDRPGPARRSPGGRPSPGAVVGDRRPAAPQGRRGRRRLRLPRVRVRAAGDRRRPAARQLVVASGARAAPVGACNAVIT